VLDSLSPPRRRLVLVTVTASVVAAIVAAVLVVVQMRGDKVTPVAQDKPGPVVLLPGYGGKVASLDPLVAALRASGRQAVVFTPTAHESGDLRVQAKRLRALVTRTLNSSHAASVDVVGYSAGGVIARLWVRDYGGASLARRVLTISSPHHGTSQASVAAETFGGACTAACVQLTEDSDLLRHLNAGDETPTGPSWITVRSSSDTVVTPISSAVLGGALNLLVQTGCPAATTSHTGMPSDPYVLATLGSSLGVGRPKAPADVRC
jgi:triacylglycerol lipase